MAEPTLADVLSRLGAIEAKLAVLIGAPAGGARISYTRAEFAAMTGRSAASLKHPKYWRALGGKKVGGRIMFSESARQAVANGRV